MRKLQHLLAGQAVIALICATCFADDDMGERAAYLAAALNVPTNSQTRASSALLFSGKQMLRNSEVRVLVVGVPKEEMSDVVILCTNNQRLAKGVIIERPSFEAARDALLRQLVLNSMPMPLIAQGSELRVNEVGDFCILKKVRDKTTGGYIVSPSVIHFVRGGKAVSLYGEKGVDVRTVAKSLDTVMCEASGMARPSDAK